ncbi:MAG: hypothetical protein QOJ78_2816 [Pseudonocardiales bacterium]|jgi:hypothetical protein|nr:hypothetical protein [Jatrophihabitans sp.]MDT4901886.1 hypothetical protein [Pseudonocardiales bacterium]
MARIAMGALLVPVLAMGAAAALEVGALMDPALEVTETDGDAVDGAT